MDEIREVAKGAFFVPSYSEQTLTSFRHGITNQTVVIRREEIAPTIIESIETPEIEDSDIQRKFT